VLVCAGRRQRIVAPPVESYEFTSMSTSSPDCHRLDRTDFVLAVVDGRQKDLSVGMTLDELARTWWAWAAWRP
jgi:hypothetical protein